VFTPPPCKEYSKDLFQVINLEAHKKMESSDSFLSFFASFSHFKSVLDGNLMEQLTEVNTTSKLQRCQKYNRLTLAYHYCKSRQ
jgi:hypothetical protein